MPKIWIISIVLGSLLAAGTWILRGTMYITEGGVIHDYGSVQEILFLEISLTQNWLIFVTRGFDTFPSFQLIGAIAAVDVLSILFCVFGWFSGGRGEPASPPSLNKFLSENGRTDFVTVCVVFVYSVAVTIVMALVYYVLTNLRVLNDMGRKKRSVTDTLIENVLTQLSKVALEHEKDDKGERFYIANRAVVEEG